MIGNPVMLPVQEGVGQKAVQAPEGLQRIKSPLWAILHLPLQYGLGLRPVGCTIRYAASAQELFWLHNGNQFPPLMCSC